MHTAMRRYRSFGVTWRSDIALDPFDADDAVRHPADIAVQAVDRLAERAGETPFGGGCVYPDGLRLRWGSEATFDVFDGRRIDYLRGPGFNGALPAAFYGTVAALTLALRGAVPFHASAVEVDGRAVLLAGAPGAGKSTLIAQMLGHGARLLSDDLSVIERTAGGPVVCRGRSTIRLHREMAHRIASTTRGAVAGDPRDKWIVRPTARSPLDRVPLAGFILLGEPDRTTASAATVRRLADQLFRPRWLEALPGHGARLAAVLRIATQLPMRGATPPRDFHRDDAAARHVLDIARAIVASAA